MNRSKGRAAELHLWYLAHREEIKARQRAYYQDIKTHPGLYARLIEAERMRKRRKFGWVRTYRKRSLNDDR